MAQLMARATGRRTNSPCLPRMRNIVDTCDDKSERLIILGDLNGWVGTLRPGFEGVIGEYGDGRVNDSGERIVSFCLEYNLFVSNTWFRHKDCHLYTWNRGDQKSLIDLVIYDERLKKCVRDTRVWRGAECGTDHFLVMSSVALGHTWRRRKKSHPVRTRIRVEELAKENVRRQYMRNLNERLGLSLIDWEEKLKINDVDGCFRMLADICVNSASEICGVAKVGRTKGTAWWNDEVAKVVAEKKETYST